MASIVSRTASSAWDTFVKMLKGILGGVNCSNHANEIVDRVLFCWDGLDNDRAEYDELELDNGVGCCILAKFDYCLRTKISQLCAAAATNLTMTAIDALSLYTSADCKVRTLPKYPSVECDNLMLPGSRLEGLVGLIISVSIFSLVLGLLVWFILYIARKRSNIDGSYQAL